jgi:hypothetical protein
MMKIAQDFTIDATTYASEANAILGIRDSGKSYTATRIAEELLEARIPFVAFDPIGVWRYLKVGQKGHSGYQVVVAGDSGDLPLTPESAVNIVRAAMRENIPLVIDLYSMKLSKADWRKIVEESIRLLLYENKPCGLRHVFIEEAAEFCPQRVGPESGRVYAEIEKLARMGGNASLGYTLINQRAEEVNKAVLELCDCLILHRQKGRHSLTALSKWLDIGDVTEHKAIIKTLPVLEQGECWIWMPGSKVPERIRVTEKRTVHPDRRDPLKATKGVSADVTTFVERMRRALEKVKPEVQAKHPHHEKPAPCTDPEIGTLRARVAALQEELAREKTRSAELTRRLDSVREHLRPEYDHLSRLFAELAEVQTAGTGPDIYDSWRSRLGTGEREMLDFFITHRRLTGKQLQVLTGKSHETVRIYRSKLIRAGLVKKDGSEFALQEFK